MKGVQDTMAVQFSASPVGGSTGRVKALICSPWDTGGWS